MFKEEKELTYAQNLKQQREFLRFLVTKLHTVNAMCDEINRDFIFDHAGSLIGSCFGWSDAAGSYSMNNRGKKDEDSKQNNQSSSSSHDIHDPVSSNSSQSPLQIFSDQHDPYTTVPYIQRYQRISGVLNNMLLNTHNHLLQISEARQALGPNFAAQLQQTPRMHEVCMMLIAAFEKLFQEIEYVQFPIKEDLAKRTCIK